MPFFFKLSNFSLIKVLPLPDIYNEVELPLSSEDVLSKVQYNMSLSKIEYVRQFPFCTIVGALQYVQVHTGVTTQYAVSVLSRFTSDHEPRHIECTTEHSRSY